MLRHKGMASPLSAAEVAYQAIQLATANTDQGFPIMEETDKLILLVWALS